MMHYDGSIVTVRQLPSGNVCREYQHYRVGEKSQSTVILDFDSEFALGFKFTDNVRRRLELWIDGAMVTDSIILDGESTLERFHDSNKRFKFVRSNHTAVADPTSSDNGDVIVKLWKEKVDPNWVTLPSVKKSNNPLPEFRNTGGGGVVRGLSGWAPSGVYTSHTFDTKLGSASQSGARGSAGPTGMLASDVVMCSATYGSASSSLPTLDSCISPEMALIGEVGATVEGSKSHQTFNTTYWRGDATEFPQLFIFKLRGRDTKTIPGLCPVCATNNTAHAKFCIECGTKIPQ
jgi:hypothetical protein